MLFFIKQLHIRFRTAKQLTSKDCRRLNEYNSKQISAILFYVQI